MLSLALLEDEPKSVAIFVYLFVSMTLICDMSDVTDILSINNFP